jgi:hypothetical protein
MSFADPQSVTVNSVAKSLPNIEKSGQASTYRMNGGDYALKISHVEAKRNRRTVRLDFQKIAADPFEPTNNLKFTGSAYLVIDAPIIGFTDTELKDNVLGLAGWLTSANVLKVLGGES